MRRMRLKLLAVIAMCTLLLGGHHIAKGQVTTDEKRVMMQAFYWDCYDESGHGNWWDYIKPKMTEVSNAGITEIWLPVSWKAEHNPSMGYDPYDYYDLGEFEQKVGTGQTKGSKETYFGSRAELESLISTIHSKGIKAYADVVFNHAGGGTLENNPNTGGSTPTKFEPLSGKYQFHYNDFHPSTFEQSDPGVFGDFPDLAHANPWVMTVLKDYQTWLVNTIGYDGFRYDWVNGMYPWVIKDLQTNHGKFGVAEYWDQNKANGLNYLTNINNTCNIFDFPLFYAIKDMCRNTGGGYDMRNLATAGINSSKPANAVTFVQNHDTDKEDQYQIPVDQLMLGYAYILTQQGLPTVFWRDYFNRGLAKNGTANGIEKLIWVRKNLATGGTSQLYSDADLVVLQRNGNPGLLLVMNDHSSQTKSVSVKTKWTNTKLIPYAWNSTGSNATPMCVVTDANGNATVSAGQRGYVVYAPDNGTSGTWNCSIVNPPPTTSRYFGGTFNNWSLTEMTSTDGGTNWSLTNVSIAAGAQSMKFTNTADWSGIDWGNASGLSGTAQVTTGGGANITFTAPSTSTYTINFNANTLQYSIVGGTSTIAVISLTVSPTSASLTTGTTQQLTATITPSNATNKNVTWASSNTAIATVNSSGLVTAVGAGSTTITATSVSNTNIKASSSVTVSAPVQNIYVAGSFNGWALTQMTLTSGVYKLSNVQLAIGSYQLKFANTSNWSGVDWGNASGLTGTAQVTTGGGANITFTISTVSQYNFSFNTTTLAYSIVNNVSTVAVTGVAVSPTSATVTAGGTQQLTATITPSNATNKNVTWSSSNNGVATVNSSGLVTAVAVGSATITATSISNTAVKGTSAITVSAPAQSIYVAGSFNGWSLTQMTLTSGVYKYTNVQLATGNYQLKFANSGNWSGIDWGNASGLSGTAKVTTGGGANISFTISTAGLYTFTFNASTLVYSITLSTGARIADQEIQSNEQSTGFSIYPNPAGSSDHIIISGAKDRSGTAWVTVTDMLGRQVYRSTLEMSEHMTIPYDFAAGMHIIQILHFGQQQTMKLVIR